MADATVAAVNGVGGSEADNVANGAAVAAAEEEFVHFWGSFVGEVFDG